MLRCIAIGVAALTLLGAPTVRAQTAKWDQAAVTAAAKEYSDAVSGLRDAVRQSNAWNITPNRPKLYQIQQDLRQIEWLAQSLYGDLSKGADMQATTPIWNQIQQNREYAKADAMFVDITDFIKPKLEAARKAQTKLAAFYPPSPAN